MNMQWTDERVEKLKRLWAEGLSASQIAGELGNGITRNAVIGKVHRLGLSGRVKAASSAPSRPRIGTVGRLGEECVEEPPAVFQRAFGFE